MRLLWRIRRSQRIQSLLAARYIRRHGRIKSGVRKDRGGSDVPKDVGFLRRKCAIASSNFRNRSCKRRRAIVRFGGLSCGQKDCLRLERQNFGSVSVEGRQGGMPGRSK